MENWTIKIKNGHDRNPGIPVRLLPLSFGVDIVRSGPNDAIRIFKWRQFEYDGSRSDGVKFPFSGPIEQVGKAGNKGMSSQNLNVHLVLCLF